jgi:hypothetical protein
MDSDEIDLLTAPFLASDLAAEVRSVYYEHAGVGTGAGPATAAVFDTFRELLADSNEGPVVLLALAALQVRDGLVLEPIRDAALALIESGDANRAWRPLDAVMIRQRKEALTRFAELLIR